MNQNQLAGLVFTSPAFFVKNDVQAKDVQREDVQQIHTMKKIYPTSNISNLSKNSILIGLIDLDGFEKMIPFYSIHT